MASKALISFGRKFPFKNIKKGNECLSIVLFKSDKPEVYDRLKTDDLIISAEKIVKEINEDGDFSKSKVKVDNSSSGSQLEVSTVGDKLSDLKQETVATSVLGGVLQSTSLPVSEGTAGVSQGDGKPLKDLSKGTVKSTEEKAAGTIQGEKSEITSVNMPKNIDGVLLTASSEKKIQPLPTVKVEASQFAPPLTQPMKTDILPVGTENENVLRTQRKTTTTPDLLKTTRILYGFPVESVEGSVSAGVVEPESPFKIQESEASSVRTLLDAVPATPLYPPIDLTTETQRETYKAMPTRSEPVAAAFEQVPGPTTLRLLGKVWRYVPALGTQIVSMLIYATQVLISTYDRKRKYSSFLPYNYLLDKFGSVVRLHAPMGADIVLLGVDGVNVHFIASPGKSMFDSLVEYRKDALVPQYTQLNTELPPPAAEAFRTEMFVPKFETLCDGLINRTKLLRSYQDEVSDTYKSELTKWALECTTEVYFAKRLGFFSDDYDSALATESGRLLHAVVNATESLRLCETGIQLWRFMPTFSWSQLSESCRTMDGIIAEEANKVLEGMNSGSKADESLLKLLLSSGELTTSQDMLSPLVDALIVTVNALSSSAGFLMYHLANNPSAQKRLFAEILPYLPSRDSRVSVGDLSHFKYLNCCITESLRLKPPVTFLSKLTEEDLLVNGYVIPKGTFVQMVNRLTCGDSSSKGVQDMNKFEPERWLEGQDGLKGDPLVGLPYWTCCPVTRDLFITPLTILITKIVRTFQVEHNKEPVKPADMLLSGSNVASKLKLIERKSK